MTTITPKAHTLSERFNECVTKDDGRVFLAEGDSEILDGVLAALRQAERPTGIDLIASIADCMLHQDALPGVVKTRVDLDRYEAILGRSNPDLIIECGTHWGGSALWFADHSDAHVITIDIQSHLHHELVGGWAGRVDMVYGSSINPGIVAAVTEQAAKYERVMVVLDSDHATEHVYRELLAYAPLVTLDQALVVEDTLCRWMPWWNYGDGPLGAVESYMVGDIGRCWAVDSEIALMHNRTQNPGGWLRRVGTMS